MLQTRVTGTNDVPLGKRRVFGGQSDPSQNDNSSGIHDIPSNPIPPPPMPAPVAVAAAPASTPAPIKVTLIRESERLRGEVKQKVIGNGAPAAEEGN